MKWLAMVAALAMPLAQATAQETERTFDRLKVHMIDGSVYEATEGVLTSSRLTGLRKTGGNLDVPRAEIITINYVDGTHWRQGALGGALSGLAWVVLETIDPWIFAERPGVGASVAIIGAWTAVGTVWGMTQDRWVEFVP